MQQQIERVTAMAQQAAELLPAAPTHWDVESYMAWRELVWSTASRLGDIAGSALDGRGSVGQVDLVDGSVSAKQLLDMACSMREPANVATPVECISRAPRRQRVGSAGLRTQPQRGHGQGFARHH